jgi:hypothetical protein
MRHLEIALSAPVIPERPKVLLLCDSDEETQAWLVSRGAQVQVGSGPQGIGGLIEDQGNWDLIMATKSMQRYYETTSQSQIERFSGWLRAHSKLCLLSPRKHYVDRARNAIGPWHLDREFRVFEFISEFDRDQRGNPVVALSDMVFWDGEKWRQKTDFLQAHQSGRQEDSAQGLWGARRQHLCVDGTIFKIEMGSPEYFETLEVIKEFETIELLNPETRKILRIPKTLSLRRGAVVSALHREAIAGTPLLELDTNSKTHRNSLFEQVLDCAIDYAELGLFHNDFRPWNFLVTPTGLTLIDYAGVSRVDSDTRRIPQVAALIGTLVAVTSSGIVEKPIRMFEHFDEDVLDIVRPVLDALGIQLESLYTTPWLDLPNKRAEILESRKMGFMDFVQTICSSI